MELFSHDSWSLSRFETPKLSEHDLTCWEWRLSAGSRKILMLEVDVDTMCL